MSSFYRTVLKSYINPNASFHYPLETYLTQGQYRSHYVNNRNKRKIRENTSKGVRGLLMKSQKYVLADDFMETMFKNQYKYRENGFSREAISPPYDNMWIEFSSNNKHRSADYTETLRKMGATTDNHGYHINIYARTKETKLYLITPYRTNLYAPNLQKKLDTTIKVLAPLHSILFSTEVPLTDTEYWEHTLNTTKYRGGHNHIVKSKDYSATTERWLWGKDNYKILKDLDDSIKNYVAVRPSTFGFHYTAPCHLPMNQEGRFATNAEMDNVLSPIQNFQNNFEQLKTENGLQFHKGISIVLAILVQMNLVHNVREVKYQKSTLDKSNKSKFFHQFKTLTIDPNVKNINDYKQRLEPHHNNRYHSVRGHWRYYKTGKKVWIENYSRGDESLGIIEKEYKVVRRNK